MPEELTKEDGIGLFSPKSTPSLTKYYHRRHNQSATAGLTEYYYAVPG